MRFSFDTQSVPARDPITVLPAGWYTGQVTESEIIDTRSGTGEALKLTITVLDEGNRGRKIWVRLNIKNQNPEAERISKQQLRELCEAIGITSLRDTTDLHMRPFEMKVKVRVDLTGAYDDQNDVTRFRAVGSGSDAPRAPAGLPRPAAGGIPQGFSAPARPAAAALRPAAPPAPVQAPVQAPAAAPQAPEAAQPAATPAAPPAPAQEPAAAPAAPAAGRSIPPWAQKRA